MSKKWRTWNLLLPTIRARLFDYIQTVFSYLNLVTKNKAVLIALPPLSYLPELFCLFYNLQTPSCDNVLLNVLLNGE